MAWSYNTGERGKTWVRAYQDPRRNGALFLEYMEEVLDEEGRPVLVDGKPKKRRARTKLPHTDKRRAEKQARELSDQFATFMNGGPVTVHRLIDDYIREVTPTKRESISHHDRAAARVWKAYLPTMLLADQLNRSQWDGFIAKRKAGGLCGLGPVGERMLQYDVTWLVCVLRWGVGTGRLVANPWSAEIRRTQGWRMPKNKAPHRPGMPQDIRDALIAASPDWRFAGALELGRMTVSRNSSVRQVQWQEINLPGATVQWTHEKNGCESVTALSPAAVELLRHAPSRGIGGAYVFPSPMDPARPCSRHIMQSWLKKAKKRLLASLAEGEERETMRARLRRVGFHSEKRAAVRSPEFQSLSPKMQEAIARTHHRTLVDVYDEVGMEQMQEAVQKLG